MHGACGSVQAVQRARLWRWHRGPIDQVLERQHGSCVNRIDTKSQVSSLLWSKEHKEIISGHGYAENQLSIWSYPTLNKVAYLTGHSERVLSMSMSPDGSTVVSAAADETLRFWKCFGKNDKAKKKMRQGQATRSKLTATLR